MKSQTFCKKDSNVKSLVNGRKKTGLTQQKISDLLNISLSVVQSWEQGRRSPLPNVREWYLHELEKIAEMKVLAERNRLISLRKAAGTLRHASRKPNIPHITIKPWNGGNLSEPLKPDDFLPEK